MDALLDEARRFTVGLLQNWNMGRCQEDIVILYAQDHNIVILSVLFSLHASFVLCIVIITAFV